MLAILVEWWAGLMAGDKLSWFYLVAGGAVLVGLLNGRLFGWDSGGDGFWGGDGDGGD